MPYLRYVTNELRRRRARTVLTALGLAAGVSLVMGIVGVSAGLDRAQAKVLSPLTSVGTDILVTRTVGVTSPTSASPSPTPAPQTGRAGGGGGFFGGGPGGPPGGGAGNPLASLNDADTTALLHENSSVVTDLAKLGKPGTTFTRDFFLPGTLLTFPDTAVSQVASVSGVTSAVGGLSLLAQHQTGTVPNIVASVKTGGETLTSTVRPAALTEAEQAAVRSCIQASGGFGDDGNNASPQPRPSPGAGGGRGGLGGFGGGRFEKCLPARFQEYNAQVVTPLRTITQIVNPPTTDTTSSSYTVAGVDPASPDAGLVTRAQVTSGSWFSGTPASEVLVNTAYASKKSIAVGATLPINGTSYRVVGLVNPTLTGNTADVYFPLSTLQKVASKTGRVNAVLVRASSASQVDRVAADIKRLLPGAQVVTTKSLADNVTGSLHNAQQVASRLGGVLALIVLIAAFVIAILLTLSSVAKRVREIGTLRALGWSRRRVVGQIVSETLGIGLLGGVIGVGLGYLVAAAAHAFSPTLSATTTGVASASSVGALFNQAAPASVSTAVRLSAPISLGTIALGMGCALVGGLIAGTLGGWRAARLAPSVALRDLG
ncbi:MAG: putative transport system permease protein [Actinomycetota bacterium]|jgi:ABC-type antimicrobial peptide transport system permease subunit|nr:putative transport system permease protein [Actinomycetota bacterium]